MPERNPIKDHPSFEELQPIAPASIKPHEESIFNPAYTVVEKKGDFSPVENVPYVWVYTEDRQLLIGIEKPWDYPAAFHGKPEDILKYLNAIKTAAQTYSPELEQNAILLGHPTLSGKKKAYIAGELLYSEKTTATGEKITEMTCNNKSGRFRWAVSDETQINKLMQEVADIFVISTGIQPTIKIITNKFLSPHSMWSRVRERINKENFAGNNTDLHEEQLAILLEVCRIATKHAKVYSGISQIVQEKIGKLHQQIIMDKKSTSNNKEKKFSTPALLDTYTHIIDELSINASSTENNIDGFVIKKLKAHLDFASKQNQATMASTMAAKI